MDIHTVHYKDYDEPCYECVCCGSLWNLRFCASEWDE
jgi:hypothetical protein